MSALFVSKYDDMSSSLLRPRFTEKLCIHDIILYYCTTVKMNMYQSVGLFSSFYSWLQILASNIKNVIDGNLCLKQNTDSNEDNRNKYCPP